MTRPVAVLRPQPGNAATADALRRRGVEVVQLPLFEVAPLDWVPPPVGEHDALILTSANAVRHAGPGLGALSVLPVHVVGEATAAAARAAGLAVARIGETDGAALAAAAAASGIRRALHLAGEAHRPLDPNVVARTIPVYASVAVPAERIDAALLAGTVAMVHSPRAGERLAELVPADRRSATCIAAISARAAAASGGGWAEVAAAVRPSDAALIELALMLAD